MTFSKKILSLILFLSLFLIFDGLSVAENEVINQTCGDMKFTYNNVTGVNLEVFGISVIKESSLWVVNPRWTHHFYGTELQNDLIKTAKIESHQNSVKITLHHKMPPDKRCPFEGFQTFTLLSDNTLIIELKFEVSTLSEDSVIEWNTASLNAIPFIKQGFIVSDDAVTTSGIIPQEPDFQNDEKNIFARQFKNLILASQLGDIKIDTPKMEKYLFLDYRGGQWADVNKPKLWIGLNEMSLKNGDKFTFRVEFKFPDEFKKKSIIADVLNADIGLIKTDCALIPNWGADYIIPTPKKLQYTNTLFRLNNSTKVLIGKNPNKEILEAVEFLKIDLEKLYNIKPMIVDESLLEAKQFENCVFLSKGTDGSAAKFICEKAGIKLPAHEEGYCLFVDDKVAAIAANTEKGIFYGITSLLQLIKVSENGVFLKGAKIEDYPTLNFRGIHHFTGKDAGDQMAKAVRTLIARFKTNTLVWECQRIIWDSHPELEHQEYGMKKYDAKKVVDAANKNFIEIIPLVQALSHSEWFFANEKNLNLAENPEKPYCYDPTNPNVYQILFEVYQEAVDFFHPRYFHIGHDEVEFTNKLKHLNNDRDKLTDVIMEDTMKLYNWLAAKGIKTMLWSDIFLYPDMGLDACNAKTPQEAKRRRAMLPKDVIICDWHYEQHSPEKYVSLKLFKDEGFKVIGSPWFRPANISNFAKGCAIYGAEGMLKTTWAGYNFKIDNNPNDWIQYWDNILAGQYSWTGENTPEDDLPFAPKQVFLDLWFEKKPILKKRAGTLFDLSKLYNRKLSDDDSGSGWIGAGGDSDLRGFPIEQKIYGETCFLINKNKNGQAALMLDGKFNPEGRYPQNIEINANESVFSEIHFLLTATLRTNEDAQLGGIDINYIDGTSHKTPLLYYHNIFAYCDTRIGNQTRIAWKGRAKDGKWAQVLDYTLANPYPSKKIKSITLYSSLIESAPVFFAITGVE